MKANCLIVCYLRKTGAPWRDTGLGLSPPPITVVGGCKAGGSESHGGSPTRPLAARLDRQAPGNRHGVASGAGGYGGRSPLHR